MIRTRRQWLRAASLWVASPSLLTARKEFWESKDPGSWSKEEKEGLLWQSPWAREGLARMEIKRPPTVGYNNRGQQSIDLPDNRPGTPPGGLKSVPIGGEVPPVPKAGNGDPIQFRVLARWETAKPVQLAGPEIPEATGQSYVISLRGLPLMPPPKGKPGEPPPPDPNEGMLLAIKEGTRLERARKAAIPCARLFAKPGNAASGVLLFFPRGADAITLADKVVTLESQFSAFHLSIRFPLKEMVYKGELAL